MLWLIASNAVVLAAAPQRVSAIATIRVVRSASASGKEWQRPSTAQRREIIIDDGRGRPVLLRLFEYQ
jgi:hypothetical protein